MPKVREPLNFLPHDPILVDRKSPGRLDSRKLVVVERRPCVRLVAHKLVKAPDRRFEALDRHRPDVDVGDDRA
jgi:hypothetical protein